MEFEKMELKEREYFRVTYEIIENYPSILKSEIPIIHIFIGVIYFTVAPFLLMYAFIKRGFRFFRKVELIKGSEDNSLVEHFDLFTLEHLLFKKGDVISTMSIDLNKRETKSMSSILEGKGFSIYKNVSGNYRIRKRIEVCFSDSDEVVENEERVVLTIPKLAINLKIFFSKIYLLKD